MKNEQDVKNQNIEFTFSEKNSEWVEGKFNMAFTGKIKNEQVIRDFLIGKITDLNTMQLITLVQCGESYRAVVGSDVKKAG